jgi:hypothetical protein
VVGSRILIVGADAEPSAVFAALRKRPSRKVHIIASTRERGEGRALATILSHESIASRLWVVHADATEDAFATASKIILEEQEPVVLIAGALQAALLSAAYVHGVPALIYSAKNVRELPVLPYSYTAQLAEAKLAILEAVRDKPVQLQDVIKITHLKPNALSYHLHGTQKVPGLFSMGIAATDEKKRIVITPKGRALVRGLEGRARRT